MHSYTIYETIRGAIEDAYPAEEKPAQNAYLLDLYQWQPEVSPAMLAASVDALLCVRRIREANPDLLEIMVEAVGLEQFVEEFEEKLAVVALQTFRAARNCGV